MIGTRICKGSPRTDRPELSRYLASAYPGLFSRLGISAALGAAVLLAGCAKKEEQKQVMPPRTVSAAAAEARDLPLYIDSLGRTKAYESVSIVPQVSGTLEKIFFTQGTQVKKGQQLFAIDPALYRAAVLQAEGALEQAKAQLHIDQLQLERSRSLLPDRLISEQEFQTLEAKVEADKGAVKLAQGQLESAKVNLGYAEIASPIDGLIGFYNVTEGNLVSPSSGTALTTIQRLDPLYVDFTVTDREFIALRENYFAQDNKLPVSVRYLAGDSKDNKEYPAELKVLGNEINRSTGTVRLRAELNNEGTPFWPEQPIAARVILKTLKGAVTVPSQAVSTGQSGQYLFIIEEKDGKQIVQQVPVTIGQLQDGGKSIVITSGLKAGQRVVLEGQVFLQSGQEVVIADPSTRPGGKAAAGKAPADGKSATGKSATDKPAAASDKAEAKAPAAASKDSAKDAAAK